MKDAVFTSDAPGALFDMAVGAEKREASLRHFDREDIIRQKSRTGKAGARAAGAWLNE